MISCPRSNQEISFSGKSRFASAELSVQNFMKDWSQLKYVQLSHPAGRSNCLRKAVLYDRIRMLDFAIGSKGLYINLDRTRDKLY